MDKSIDKAIANETIQETQVPTGVLTGITFGILRESDAEKLAVLSIEGPNDVTDPRLGLPNPTSECPTCGAKSTKQCEGHFGYVKLHNRVLHPYYISEAVNILNKICPWCKSSQQNSRRKAASLLEMLNACKYCQGKTYPLVKFKLSSNELFGNPEVTVEVKEKAPNRLFEPILPDGYWDFIPKDMSQLEVGNKTTKRILTPNQIHGILKKVNPKLFKACVSSTETLFLRNFLVTPNFHRVTEFMHPLSNGQKLVFDDRTRAAKKVVGFKGSSSELVFRFTDYLKLSKLHLGKQPNEFTLLANKDAAFSASCSKWMKEVILTKRSDHIFRTVITGDPNLKLDEIGIPSYIAERMQISDNLNFWNWEKLSEVCSSLLFEKGQIHVRRKGELVRVSEMEQLQIGDVIRRSLVDGDIILINRPPSIHQHSLLGLNVKIISIDDPKLKVSTKSDVWVDYVVCINPLICAPLCGDFDGDCLHGFIPQSVESRIELIELVALDKQLTNGQNGKNLLSLTHDSLTAAHLLVEDGTFLDSFQVQQLEMFSLRKAESPVIVKAPFAKSQLCSGKQVFGMLLPGDFEFCPSPKGVHITRGEIVSCPLASSWLRGDADGNLFEALIKHCKGKSLDYLHSAQQVLCEWLSLRGLSVSLFDLYLCSDELSHKNMIDEVHCGLQEAERTCLVKQLMVEALVDYLTLAADENQSVDGTMCLEVEKMCYDKQKSSVMCRVSVSAFKQVFRDIQNLMYQYAGRDNSVLSMVKAGSRSSLAKIVQQAMSIGLQHSMVPLSFKLPHKLSCEAWNNSKDHGSSSIDEDTLDCTKSFIPYAVVESSFLGGLNPLECFVHSVTSRDSSFRENADVPGTLNRRLTFFMRDLHAAYDGTVRSAYVNQLFQFSYDSEGTSLSSEGTYSGNAVGGQPVGSLAACAISEAAYSALDQPVSVLEPSPLFNLKKVLESGLKRSNINKSVTLYLSTKLRRVRYGFEYAALEVKNHLEGLVFKDIVSKVMIEYSIEPPSPAPGLILSPWVCHFHICKDTVKRRRLKVHSIIDALHKKCSSAIHPKLNIAVKRDCLLDDMGKEKKATFCLTAYIIESSNSNPIKLDAVRDVLIPDLLQSVIKGRMEVKKVDILWNDQSDESKAPKSRNIVSGELYLKVFLSTHVRATRLWNLLMDSCLPIMELIDWTRSHPDDMHDLFTQHGIDASWRHFVGNLKSAVNDVGKTVLPQHLMLVADCLSVTGEFVGLSAKGMARQKQNMSVSSPFMLACFSSPGGSFIKAAKAGAADPLQGSLDSLAWGKVPSLGTGSKFEIIYSSKEHEIEKPTDICSLLACNKSFHMRKTKPKVPDGYEIVTDKCGAMRLKELPSKERFRNLGISKALLEAHITLTDIKKLSQTLRSMLNKYSIDEELDDVDKKMLKTALHFHPKSKDKIGPGVLNIKVGHHPIHEDARCFLLERKDGSVEDFSYHKCVVGALELFAPQKAKSYKSRWLKSKADMNNTWFETEPAVACW